MSELAQAVVNGLQMGFLYALVAVGLTIIWGLMEMINFAHGEFLMLGMFGAWWLSAGVHLDPLLAIVPIGLVMYAFGVLVYQQLMRRVQGGDPFTQIFATIGLLFLLQNAVVAGFTSDFRFVNDSVLTRLAGTKLQLGGITFGAPLLAAAGLRLTYSIGMVAGIGFLGFAANPGAADWGQMINENRLALLVLPWGVLAPVIVIGVFTIGTNLMADGITQLAEKGEDASRR